MPSRLRIGGFPWSREENQSSSFCGIPNLGFPGREPGQLGKATCAAAETARFPSVLSEARVLKKGAWIKPEISFFPSLTRSLLFVQLKNA
jgi:hypothetical protein